MKKTFLSVPAAVAIALLVLTLFGCPTEPANEFYVLSGTFTKAGVADGTFAYGKLVAQGGAPTDTTLFWVRSEAFSGGSATYEMADVEPGAYVAYAFIDVNGNAAGDGTSQPDSGDWATDGRNVTMDGDETLDVGESDWVEM